MKTIRLRNNLFVVSILLAVVSCSTLRSTKLNEPVVQDELIYHTKFIQLDSNHIANYECDDFVLNALENYTIKSIRQEYNFLKLTQEPIINLHNPSIVDTIYTFSHKKNTIKIYRARHNDFTYLFDVRYSKFKLAGAIQPGMSKATFCRKFNISETIDSKVQLSDKASNIEYLFYFKRNKLRRISANIYIE
ncbi:MAG: hypothetical protein ACERKD_09960 [Prolixibacteraceae bacterium]